MIILNLMHVYTDMVWAHRQQVSTTYLTRKNSDNFLLCSWLGLNFGSWNLESDALVIEPPRHPATNDNFLVQACNCHIWRSIIFKQIWWRKWSRVEDFFFMCPWKLTKHLMMKMHLVNWYRSNSKLAMRMHQTKHSPDMETCGLSYKVRVVCLLTPRHQDLTLSVSNIAYIPVHMFLIL